MSAPVRNLPAMLNPSGLCECGCGEETPRATYHAPARGYFRGEHVRFIRGHHRRHSPNLWIEEDHGHESGCWVWQGWIDRNGYARTGWGPGKRGSREAHRAIYEREIGAVPDGMTLDHLCRVRHCVRPDHLEPVTNAQNCRRGAATKLTWADVDAIRARLRSGAMQRRVAREFGISDSHISRIAHGTVWSEGTR